MFLFAPDKWLEKETFLYNARASLSVNMILYTIPEPCLSTMSIRFTSMSNSMLFSGIGVLGSMLYVYVTKTRIPASVFPNRESSFCSVSRYVRCPILMNSFIF